MAKRKVVLALFILFVVLLAVTFIWWNQSDEEFSRSQTASPPSKDSAATVCVVQYVSHPLLDAVYAGFRDELKRSGFEMDSIRFFNANNDSTTSKILADQVCSDDSCSLIFALATPMAQSVKASCKTKTPILFGAITDPISAQLVQKMGAPGSNITGTSDQWPYHLQMQLIGRLWGTQARVGVPYNPSEANTQYAMQQTRKAASEIGLDLIEMPINSLGEATQAVDALAGRIDVLYIPADNTVIAAAAGVIAATERHQIPVFAGDPGTFEAGAALGLGVDYRNLGVINAQQALKILGGTKPGSLAVQTSDKPELYVNEEKAALYGLNIENIHAQHREISTQ